MILLRLLGIGVAYGLAFTFVKSLFPEPFVLLIMQGGGSSEGDLTTLALVYMGVGLISGLIAAPIFGGALLLRRGRGEDGGSGSRLILSLALAMLTDVVTALLDVPELDRVSVVSPDDDVLSLASALGASPIAESANVRGLNQALARALSAMSPQPGGLHVVLGDLPEIDARDVQRLLAELPARGAAAAPSDDGGTSALAVRPPDAMELRFGPRSFQAHREAARRAGAEFRAVSLRSLAHDVDSPDDLRRLASQHGTTATHQVIERLGLGERLVGA